MNFQGLSSSVKIFFNANTLLLLLLCFTIFGVTLLPELWYAAAYIILLSLILICVIFCLDKHYLFLSNIAVTALIIILIIGFFTGKRLINGISDGLNGMFFIFVVVRLLVQVARSKMVTAKVIIQAVSGFLLLGLVFSLAIARVESFHPGAFSFPVNENGPGISRFYDQLYFGFITMGTVGYGDIVPKMPFAKSLTTLIGVSGQLYVAIVIAMLIGKYSASPDQSN